MPTNLTLRTCFRCVVFGSVVVMLVVFPSLGQNRALEVYWTDRGINNYEVGNSRGGVIRDQNSTLVLVPMPSDGMVPKTQAEWIRFGDSMERFFRAKFAGAVASGTPRVEVLTQQDMKTGGYFLDSERQGNVSEFTKQIGRAMLKAKGEFESKGLSVSVEGTFGSNGGRAASEALPNLSSEGRNLFDHVTYVDARAEKVQVQKGCNSLPRGCTIINTEGDIPAPKSKAFDKVSPANDEGQKLIANHSVAREIQSDKIRVLQVKVWDPTDNSNHIAPLKVKGVDSSTPVEVKEWTGSSYTPYSRLMTRNELLHDARKVRTSSSLLDPRASIPSSQSTPESAPAKDVQAFVPTEPSAKEKAGWQRNQDIVAGETFGKSGLSAGSAEESLTQIINDPSGMRIEVIREPNKPSKVLILDPPASREAELQDPHNWAPNPNRDVPTASTGDGEIPLQTPNPQSTQPPAADPQVKQYLDELTQLKGKYQDYLSQNAEQRKRIDQHKEEWRKHTIQSIGDILKDLVEEGGIPNTLPKTPAEFVATVKNSIEQLNSAFEHLNDLVDDQTDQAEAELRRQKLDGELAKTSAALKKAIEHRTAQQQGKSEPLRQGSMHTSYDEGKTWKLTDSTSGSDASSTSDFSTDVKMFDDPAVISDPILTRELPLVAHSTGQKRTDSTNTNSFDSGGRRGSSWFDDWWPLISQGLFTAAQIAEQIEAGNQAEKAERLRQEDQRLRAEQQNEERRQALKRLREQNIIKQQIFLEKLRNRGAATTAPGTATAPVPTIVPPVVQPVQRPPVNPGSPQPETTWCDNPAWDRANEDSARYIRQGNFRAAAAAIRNPDGSYIAKFIRCPK
jgi:hypothetical protein